jgi:predicted phosphodiesterase
LAIKRLVLIGCGHIGSKHTNLADFRKYVDLLKEKSTYGLVLGDIFENAITARGEGMMNDQASTPEDQLEEGVRIFGPYKNKIIGACTSNHSRRTYKEVGIDIDRQLWRRVCGEKSSVYHGLQGVVVFEGKKIAFAHGNGSGENWNDAKKLFAVYPTADIVCVSHRHEMTSKWYGSYSLDSLGRRTRRHTLFARTGGLMDWAPYAQEALYQPQKPGFTILYFLPDGTVRVDTNGI